ncbi:hypothetical protein [Streptomyces sp. NPDC048473]|uniref:hypothetical protein n=1 Tax=Streptomyces sp. NPDC048473 TaxID=3365556 RepID=UPI003723B7F5
MRDVPRLSVDREALPTATVDNSHRAVGTPVALVRPATMVIKAPAGAFLRS